MLPIIACKKKGKGGATWGPNPFGGVGGEMEDGTIYTRNAFAQALQRRGFPFPNKCFMQLHKIPMGKTTKALGNIKLQPPLNFTSYWENNTGTMEYKNPTPVKLYIQLGRSTKVLGHIKLPPTLNFTFNWDDQQRY